MLIPKSGLLLNSDEAEKAYFICLLKDILIYKIGIFTCFSCFSRRQEVGLLPSGINSKAGILEKAGISPNALFHTFHPKFLEVYLEISSNLFFSGTIGWIPAIQCRILILMNRLIFEQPYFPICFQCKHFFVSFAEMKWAVFVGGHVVDDLPRLRR